MPEPPIGNQFDGIEPNRQTPKHPARVGRATNRWDEVHSVVGNFDTVVVSGFAIVPYDDSMVQAGLIGVTIFGSGDPPPPPSSYIVIHSLGTEFVDVQFYDLTKKVLYPDSITVIDKDSIQIDFVEPQEGTVLIQRGKVVSL